MKILAVLLAAGAIVLANTNSICAQGNSTTEDRVEIVVLGVAQDAGYPQSGCRLACCQSAWKDTSRARPPVCLGLVDHQSGQRWLFECTPEFKTQLHELDQVLPPRSGIGLDGILITHAHIGHYLGLANLGREVIGTQNVPVYCMPRLQEFLSQSGPWRQLVTLRNVDLRPIAAEQVIPLNDRIAVTPIRVPHRDEYSETVAFRIRGPNRSVLFLPDIDKWNRWDRKLEEELAKVDYAFLDATFYDGAELPGRDLTEIPHPFVSETMDRLNGVDPIQKSKVHLIHFNHTNPLLDLNSVQSKTVIDSGLHIAKYLERLPL